MKTRRKALQRKDYLEFLAGIVFVAATFILTRGMYPIVRTKYQEYIKPYMSRGKGGTCKQYGPLPVDKFLRPYTVKPGDSLTSIAESELGHINRVYEILSLNRHTYPRLSQSEHPLIEPGWVLQLPKDEYFDVGHFDYSAGKIIESGRGELHVTSDSRHASSGPLLGGFSQAVVVGNEYVRPGACVTVLRIEHSTTSKRLVIVAPQ